MPFTNERFLSFTSRNNQILIIMNPYKVETVVDKQFVVKSRISFPPLIQELSHFSKPISGYFSEFNLLFMASGSRLFFWDYGSTNQWFSYDGIDRNILFVDLVRLKQGIFDMSIEYGIVIITTSDILLLSIQLSDQHVFIPIVPEAQVVIAPLHVSVPTNGLEITNLICTKYGRVLLGCSDGTIQEFIYEPRVFFSIVCSFLVLFLELYWNDYFSVHF